MTNLKQVIASVLRDVVQAQHEANTYAKELARQGVSADAKALLPLARVGELTLGLRYAVLEGEDVSESMVPNAESQERLLSRIATQLARLVIRKLVHEVKVSGIAYHPNGYSYIDDLGDNYSLIDYTAQRMLTALRADSARLYQADYSMDIEAVADIVLAVGEQYVLRHSDIEGLFDLEGGSALLQRLHEVLDLEVSDSIAKLLDEVGSEALFSRRTDRSMRIEIDADKLRDYPAEAIQSISLTIATEPTSGSTS